MSLFSVTNKEGKAVPPINFSLRVIATDLPIDDKDFKIKLELDMIPEFTSDECKTEPNFSSKRVKEILNFIKGPVINKVLEFIYYDISIKSDKKVKANVPDYDLVYDIYDERRTQIKKLQEDLKNEKIDEKQCNARKEKVRNHKENIVTKAVSKLVASDYVHPNESCISTIRFSKCSPSSLNVTMQFTVNGERKLPPPPSAQPY